MAYKKPAPTRDNNKTKRGQLIEANPESMPLTCVNFIIMAIAAIMIISGFLLMLGSGTTEAGFNPDIFSVRRIIVGPTISFLGFVVMGVGIIYLPGNESLKNRVGRLLKFQSRK